MDKTLQLTIAKLELKQLELIDKLSIKNNDYIIRVIMSTVTDRFVDVNGDWELVTGVPESICVNKSWQDISPKNEIPTILQSLDYMKKNKDYFNEFKSHVIKRNGGLVPVDWKGKYFPEINGILLIGKVCK